MNITTNIKDAYIDYKYFLNRGYSRKIALDAVSARYNLSKLERLLLYRCVHSDLEITNVRSKIIETSKELVIDGYNIALTLISGMKGEEIYECDDGFFRDLGLGKHKNSEMLSDVLILVVEYCEKLKIRCEVILDKQISKSGEISSELRKRGIMVKTVDKADKEVIISKKPVYSNDFVILFNSHMISTILNNLFQDYKIVKLNW